MRAAGGPTGTPPAASILVVSSKTGPRLERCLGHLRPQAAAHGAEVVVVANGRAAWRALDRRVPDGVRLVRSPVNLGFAGGLHLARRHALGDVLVVVQDDVEVAPGWLAPLLGALDASPALGLVGSRIDTSAGEPRHCGWVLSRLLPHPATDAVLARWSGDAAEVVPVELCNSSSLAMRAEAWDRGCGPHRRFYPVEFVDFDLGMRCLVGGWGVAVAPASTVRHPQHGSLAGPRRQALHLRNMRWWQHRWRHALGRLPLDPDEVDDVVAAGLDRAASYPHPLAGVSHRRPSPPAGRARLVAEAVGDRVRLELTLPLQRVRTVAGPTVEQAQASWQRQKRRLVRIRDRATGRAAGRPSSGSSRRGGSAAAASRG
jgi:GT2 family glycosyltransferase